MNSLKLFLVAIIFYSVNVYSRELATLGGSFDSTIFDSFRATPAQTAGYGFSSFLSNTLDSSTQFSNGTFASFLGANNTAGGSGTLAGSNSLVATFDGIQSTVSLNSDQIASSDGAGESFVQGTGFGRTQFGDNSFAGFDSIGLNVNGPSNSAVSVGIQDGSAIARDGFSQSASTLCFGSGCL